MQKIGQTQSSGSLKTSKSAKENFEQFKKGLLNIDSWSLLPSSFSSGIIPKFSEFANSAHASILLKILKSH
ncbi:MAG: hypothetical protein QXV64_02230 [Candidatus Anstonellaceae archaeon]